MLKNVCDEQGGTRAKCKIDLYPCIALEDLDSLDTIKPPLVSCHLSFSYS